MLPNVLRVEAATFLLEAVPGEPRRRRDQVRIYVKYLPERRIECAWKLELQIKILMMRPKRMVFSPDPQCCSLELDLFAANESRRTDEMR